MPTPGPPRRVSLGYILGFSDKPFKDPKPPSPPRPRRPSQLTELVASPGGIVEWTASDGRKGTLTGTGKPRLTAATLAKVPSNTRSAKAPTDTKAASKKATSTKPVNNLVYEWDYGNPGYTEEKKGSNKSVSKKVPSNKEYNWGDTPWGGDGSAKVSQKAASGIGKASNSGDVADLWGPQVVATDMETKQDEKKNGTSEVKSGEQEKTSIVGSQVGASDTAESAKDDTKKPDDSNAWTKEQDERMLQMKTENGNIAWDTIAINVGKPAKECKERWKVIMPTGWRPNDAKKKSDKKDMGKNTDAKSHDQKDTNSSDANRKDEDADDPWINGVGGLLDDNADEKQDEEKKPSGWGNWNDGGGAMTMGWEFPNAGDANQAKYGANSWGDMDGTNDVNKDGGVDWDQTDGDAIAAAWDAPDQQSNYITQEWPSAVKLASASRSNKAPSDARTRRSNKAPSEACSHHTNTSKSKPPSNSPAEIELEPDDIFSAEDLRLIARILQQDCSLVWNRVSWRFRDKTGRTLHPNVFEKKITGTVESKSKRNQGDNRRN
ncbi:hypothetical protein yc1106_03449 [Curvularia clavata]|uniref:Myb-like domain-containing protein n=1 Tax=Curvularia clavata TaxID=95742 RepID=A0A9Q8Z6Q1_CURCL|nr:hypothetical protein yc1106_03449 [Curvularia clavata]